MALFAVTADAHVVEYGRFLPQHAWKGKGGQARLYPINQPIDSISYQPANWLYILSASQVTISYHPAKWLYILSASQVTLYPISQSTASPLWFLGVGLCSSRQCHFVHLSWSWTLAAAMGSQPSTTRPSTNFLFFLQPILNPLLPSISFQTEWGTYSYRRHG
jgi:hypothetical protein